MITEIAQIDVKPGMEREFEAGVAKAREIVRPCARVSRASRLHRSIEKPQRYRLVIEWETLENHTVDFYGSDDWKAWRALVGALLCGPAGGRAHQHGADAVGRRSVLLVRVPFKNINICRGSVGLAGAGEVDLAGRAGMVAAHPPLLVGRSQVVRQRILIPPSPGSNPGAPASQSGDNVKYMRCREKARQFGDYFGFCKRSPNSQIRIRGRSLPKVSTDSLNYSRFLESLTRDYFDSRMDAPRGCGRKACREVKLTLDLDRT